MLMSFSMVVGKAHRSAKDAGLYILTLLLNFAPKALEGLINACYRILEYVTSTNCLDILVLVDRNCRKATRGGAKKERSLRSDQ